MGFLEKSDSVAFQILPIHLTLFFHKGRHFTIQLSVNILNFPHKSMTFFFVAGFDFHNAKLISFF